MLSAYRSFQHICTLLVHTDYAVVALTRIWDFVHPDVIY